VETIKRHTRATHTAAWLQAKVRDRGLGMRPRLYAGPVCDDSVAGAAYVVIAPLLIMNLTFTYLY